MTRFFREPISAYGVRTPEVKRIAAAASKAVKTWPVKDRDELCRRLWEPGLMEEGSIAICLYYRFRRQCAAREFRLFERWIDRYVHNWGHCDGVSSWLLAACVENSPDLLPRLDAWTGSRNRWKRRAAAVSLIQEAKHGRNLEAILRISAALIEDPDDMVQKGVGWLLKVAYSRKPSEVVRFLAARGAGAPRLLLRYAAEKMTAADRARVLGRVSR